MATCGTKNLISDNLAIQIDTTNFNSWNLNTGLTINSINRWNGAISDDLNLLDFGLTAFDNGRVDNLISELNLTKNDIYLNLFRIGAYSETGNTISYENLNINPITGTSVGNYFNLDGGYFQGFFKLFDYNYELFPARTNEGITIETLIEILPNSKGIFYSMGLRAEDKYNPFYDGEAAILPIPTGNTITGGTYPYQYGNYPYGYLYGNGKTGYTVNYTGLTTSEGNFLISNTKEKVRLDKFQKPEDSTVEIDSSSMQIDNIKNNIISFELTTDKRLKYKLIDNNANLIQGESPNQLTKIGWTQIDIVFKPYEKIINFDNNTYKCYPRRKGDLMFYVNGRLFWKINDFDEFYFTEINNDREKQIGVPFNISWGGGSFGLKNSYHYNVVTSISGTSDYTYSVSAITSGTTISKDTAKNGLLIENYFNDNFIGNIQKLRLYTRSLTSNEILNNLEYEVYMNPNYNITITKGGRIINQYQTVTYIPQQTAGSDIRKTIRYRNSDGTYKNLFNMIDIKVLIKSRSNPTVELIKFSKTGTTGYTELIYITEFAYDFIVPDTITSQHANEILFAEIKFQWIDVNDIDGVYDKIFVIDIVDNSLLNNTIKNI